MLEEVEKLKEHLDEMEKENTRLFNRIYDLDDESYDILRRMERLKAEIYGQEVLEIDTDRLDD